MFSSQARQGFTYRWTKCTSLCWRDLQRFVFWPRTAAALFGRDNEQRGARRRDVVKISAHQTIWLPLPSILPLHLSHFHSSYSSFFVFVFLCLGKNALPGAAWQMKTLEGCIEGKREKRKPERKKGGGGGKWKVVLKCFAALVGFSLLTFQFKQTICWLGDVPSAVIHGGEWCELSEK